MTRDLEALFAPASVAVIGASEDQRKWGNWLARGALSGESRRPAYLVNHRARELFGRRAYASLAELPERPDLVVVAVPFAAVHGAVDEALAAGARAIVAISAGGDASDDAALAARVAAAGAVLLGPNCLGVLDSGEELHLASSPLPAGAIGLISQSGNLALELGLLAAPEGLGFSRFASLGNQAHLEATDLVHAFAEHEATRLIALYVEDFRDGRAFARAAAQAVAAGKPVVALAIEHGEATTRAVSSHTGALASDGAAIDAACRAAGVQRVRTPREMIDTAHALLRARPAPGRRVAVLADGGGHGSIAAAVAAGLGLEVPELAPSVVAGLRAELPAAAGVSNPVDLAGGAEMDVHTFDRVAHTLLSEDQADALLITGYLGGYAESGPEVEAEEIEVAARLGEVAAEIGRPIVVHTMFPRGVPAVALRDAGVPVYESVEQAAAAVARLADAGASTAGLVPDLPIAEPEADGDGYDAARAVLAAGGVPFVAQRTVVTAQEALAAGRDIGYPVALKALGALHKSEGGGVVLGIPDAAALERAFDDMRARLAPPACSVEAMAPLADGVELLIGARWDPRFGPITLAGAGGIHAEALRDTTVALAPVDPAQAEAMLRALQIAPLLLGARGRPPVDIAAAAAALSALSRVAAAHPELAELEVNPLLATPAGAVALDARFVRAIPTPRSREDAVHLHA
jgi:acetate---CoA ligase (ADP-forming)